MSDDAPDPVVLAGLDRRVFDGDVHQRDRRTVRNGAVLVVAAGVQTHRDLKTKK